MSWRDRAACRTMDPEIFMGHSFVLARKVCLGCPARRPCLDEALAEERGLPRVERAGVRGGLTVRQRIQIERVAG